jgi:hexokinase
MTALRALASFITRRSSAIVATCVYSLWDLRIESEVALAASQPEARERATAEAQLPQTMVAFNGSVIENYPGYLLNCQTYVDELVAAHAKTSSGAIDLVAAKESSLLGAAVALAAIVDEAR